MNRTRKDEIGGCVPKSSMVKAALSLARQGNPVFPCKIADKSPHYRKGLIEHGHLDATTDMDAVTRYWEKWPDANIGVPTGQTTKRFVLDIDVREEVDGLASLKELERKYGKLPKTLTIRTPSGGLHLHFQHPGSRIPNCTGESALALGVEVKGDGGYVITAPSSGYEVVKNCEVVEAPLWLLELILSNSINEHERKHSSYEESVPACSSSDLQELTRFFSEGDTIKSGCRNNTLFCIAMTARRRGVGKEHLQGLLEEVNRRRCSPPLKEDEVKRIARSALKTGLSKRPLSEDGREVLRNAASELDTRRWSGMAGKTARSVYRALIEMAYAVGTDIASGVRVSISVRSLALICGVGTNTVCSATKRLKGEGLIRRDLFERKGKESGAYILLRDTPRSGSSDKTAGGAQDRNTSNMSGISSSVECGSVSKVRLSDGEVQESAAYLRWGSGALGKSKEHIVDILSRVEGCLSLEELAETVGVKRKRDLTRRQLTPLVEKGILELDEEDGRQVYSLAFGWRKQIEKIRIRNGEEQTSRRAANRIESERKSHQEHLYHSKGRRRRKVSRRKTPDPLRDHEMLVHDPGRRSRPLSGQ